MVESGASPSGKFIFKPPRAGFSGAIPLLNKILIGKWDGIFVFNDACSLPLDAVVGFPIFINWGNNGASVEMLQILAVVFHQLVPSVDFEMAAIRKLKSGLQFVNDQIDAHVYAHLCNGIGYVTAAAHSKKTARMAPWPSLFIRLQLALPGFGIVICLFLLESNWMSSSCTITAISNENNGMCYFYCLVIYKRIHRRFFDTMVVVRNPSDEVYKIKFGALKANFGIHHSAPMSTGEVKLNDDHGLCCIWIENLLTEQELISIFRCTRFYLLDDVHGEEAVPVVRVDPPVVDDNTSVTVPQIQQQGHPSLSLVRDLQYLQLNTPLPQVHTPDRPPGEPPAGHQLVWSTEALGDSSCGTFGSDLSTDGRSPFGSSCSLQHLHYALSSICIWVVQPLPVSCSTMQSHHVL